MSGRRRAPIIAGVLIIAGCSSSSRTSPPANSAAPVESSKRASTTSARSPSDSTTSSIGSSSPIDPEQPITTDQLVPAPTELGPTFATSDDLLPARTTGALHDAGGQALDVDVALSDFGVYGLPRPSGANSAVMELDVTATRLAATDGTSLSTEVMYMVASDQRIDDLLDDVAATFMPRDASSAPESVPDYDGTTGDPRCARRHVDSDTTAVLSVEGCEYHADPLTAVRSIGVRRLNMLVAGPPTPPPVFDDVPQALLTAGELTGYTATFGRPAGPSGNTVQLTLQVQLATDLPEPGDGWRADGPGRWWSASATITVDAATATWRSSRRVAS